MGTDVVESASRHYAPLGEQTLAARRNHDTKSAARLDDRVIARLGRLQYAFHYKCAL